MSLVILSSKASTPPLTNKRTSSSNSLRSSKKQMKDEKGNKFNFKEHQSEIRQQNREVIINQTKSTLQTNGCVQNFKNELSKPQQELQPENFAKMLIEFKEIIVLDTREIRKYKTGHVKGARSINCTSRSMIIKAKKDIKLLKASNPQHAIIIYNENGTINNIMNDFIEFVRNEFLIVYFLIGGYENFLKIKCSDLIDITLPKDEYDQHHYSPTNTNNRSSDVLHATMTEILPHLYLGNDMDANDIEMLREKRITHILNVTHNIPFYHEKDFTYKRLSASDSNKQNMRAYYSEAIGFIEESRASNGKVLVHCWAGVSRSATIVSAYLLKHTRLSVLDIINFLKCKRSIVEPNFNFLGQLQRYYSDLESNVEQRNLLNLDLFRSVEDEASKQAEMLEKLKLSSINSNSSSSSSNSDNNSPLLNGSHNSTTQKPFFTFFGSSVS